MNLKHTQTKRNYNLKTEIIIISRSVIQSMIIGRAKIAIWLSPCRYVLLWQKPKLINQHHNDAKTQRYKRQTISIRWKTLKSSTLTTSKYTKYQTLWEERPRYTWRKTEKNIIYNVQTSNYILNLKIRTILCVCVWMCMTFLVIHSVTNKTAEPWHKKSLFNLNRMGTVNK